MPARPASGPAAPSPGAPSPGAPSPGAPSPGAPNPGASSPASSTESAPPRRPGRRRLLLRAALATAAVLAALALYLSRDRVDYFHARRGTLVETVRLGTESEGAILREDLRLVSSSGLQVDLAVRRRTDGTLERAPAVLLIGGHRTGRDAVDLVDDLDGVVIAALDYPYDGPEKARGLAVLPLVWEARTALLDTPAALLLALDHLRQRPDVDPERIELVGVSLGAPLVCVAGALDPGFARVWSVHGGARPNLLFDHALREDIGFTPLRRLAAGIAALLVAPVAPERHVAGVSPRPFVQVNAAQDERIPRVCAEELQEAARAPKELLWRDGNHIEPDREEIVQDLVGLVLDRVRSESAEAGR